MGNENKTSTNKSVDTGCYNQVHRKISCTIKGNSQFTILERLSIEFTSAGGTANKTPNTNGLLLNAQGSILNVNTV